MAQALYRRFRPKRFRDVVGQGDAAEALKNQVASKRIGHAYIFTGIRGTGKTTLARILAKAVNCRNSSGGEPCGECEICVGIDNGSILDVTEIDAASNNGVDNIRDLRDETVYTPSVADKRVYIIDEVHMLSAGAFNALLKILEEPPEHVMFIMATTEIHKVPATVLSRCQRFDLKRVSVRDISGLLAEIAVQEGIALGNAAADMIARLADGAVRDALSILDTCRSFGTDIDEDMVRRLSGRTDAGYLFELCEEVAFGNAGGALKKTDGIYAESLSVQAVAGELLTHFRNLLIMSEGAEEILKDYSPAEIARYAAQKDLFSRKRIVESLKLIKGLLTGLPLAADKRVQFELCVVELCELRDSDSPNIKSISELGSESEKTGTPPEKEDLITELTANIAENAPEDGDVPPWDIPDETAVRREMEKGQSAKADGAAETDISEGKFLEWPRVVEAMKTKNGMLYGFMRDSSAYLSKTHILIDCGDAFKERLREKKEYADVVKETIAEVTGLRMPIGPYARDEEVPEARVSGTLERFIEEAKEKGVPVVIK